MFSQLFLLTILLDNVSSLPDLFNLADTCTADNIGEGCGFESNVGECCNDGGTFKCISVSVCFDEWGKTFDSETCACKTHWYVTVVMIASISLLGCLVLWCFACVLLCMCRSSVRDKLKTTVGLKSAYMKQSNVGGITSTGQPNFEQFDSVVELGKGQVIEIDESSCVETTDDDDDSTEENLKEQFVSYSNLKDIKFVSESNLNEAGLKTVETMAPEQIDLMISDYKLKLTEMEKVINEKMFIYTPKAGKKSFLISGKDLTMRMGGVNLDVLMAGRSKQQSRALKIAQAKKLQEKNKK